MVESGRLVIPPVLGQSETKASELREAVIERRDLRLVSVIRRGGSCLLFPATIPWNF